MIRVTVGYQGAEQHFQSITLQKILSFLAYVAVDAALKF